MLKKVCKMLNVKSVFKRLNTNRFKRLTTNRFKKLNTDRLNFLAQQSLCKSNKTFSARANETYRGLHPQGNSRYKETPYEKAC